MKLDRRLNLILSVERESDTVYVHSTPIPTELYERYFLTLTKTWALLAENGAEYMIRMGPRVAKLMMKRFAEADGAWEGPEGAELGLFGHIRRTSMVMVPAPGGGWQNMPLDHAISAKVFDEDDLAEVENAVGFFIAGSASMSRRDAAGLMKAAFGLFGGQVESWSAMEFQSSLPTSTPVETTGETVPLSSIPV